MKRRVSLQELQRKIVADDQALLMYSVAGAQAYAFVVTRDTMMAVSLGSLPSLAGEISNGERMPAKDLYQMSLSADMVVLSACEAGGGKLINGEGIIGLVRAFTYAGAGSVVASQWLAGDQSTAVLMIEFYRRLQKGLPKDKALQAARLHLIRNFPAQAHPFFWAGFRLYGASR